MDITLYLMTQKGFEVLKVLIARNFNKMISEVVIGNDKNIEDDFSEKIVTLCQLNTIRFFMKNDTYDITSDFSIAVSWRWLIPQNNSKLIVLHDSLLPKYRGFSPLVNMLINKEQEIGVSAIFASEEYDKGDIIAQTSTKIEYPITISQAIELIVLNYTELVVTIFEDISKGNKLSGRKQIEEYASYSLWRDENDYKIDWNQSSESILNFVNAVSKPYKGAYTFINGSQKIRVLKVALQNDVHIENRDVGKVIFFKDNYPVIVCKSGLIKLLSVIDDETNENLLPFKKFRIRLMDYNK